MRFIRLLLAVILALVVGFFTSPAVHAAVPTYVPSSASSATDSSFHSTTASKPKTKVTLTVSCTYPALNLFKGPKDPQIPVSYTLKSNKTIKVTVEVVLTNVGFKQVITPIPNLKIKKGKPQTINKTLTVDVVPRKNNTAYKLQVNVWQSDKKLASKPCGEFIYTD